MLVLSSVIIIGQSDTRSIEYVIGLLKKITLEELLFEWGTFFRVYLFSGTFFKDLLERIGLPVLSLLPFLTFVNWEGPYLAAGYLHNFCPRFDIMFAPFITETSNKIVEIVVTECYLIINPFKKYRIKEPAVSNTPSRKTIWRKNVNEKGKKFIVTSLQYYQFQQDGCKNL